MSKKLQLSELIGGYDNLAIMYSGGVDSTFLLKAAVETLGNRALALLADSCLIPRSEVEFAKKVAADMGARLKIVELSPLDIEEVRQNDPKRCYYCKKRVFSALIERGQALGFTHFADGQNADDQKVYRPGGAASKELLVISPLSELGFTKDDIRHYSRELGLSTHDKPAGGCLATRLPYHTRLTTELLSVIESAEEFLHNIGIGQCRTRIHGDLLRLELLHEDFAKVVGNCDLISHMRGLGFNYITLDLEGFSSGSMDRVIK